MFENASPLDLGKLACDALMKKYKPEELPPKGAFFYHQGVFLSGMQKIYDECGEKRYFDYVKEYVDAVLFEDDELVGYSDRVSLENKPKLVQDTKIMLDNKQPVILLYNLYDETGDIKYIKAIKEISQSLLYWPVNRFGGYWHMITQPYQMWMDGAYMAGPLSVMYSKRFGDPVLRERAIRQVLLMNRYMKDEKTGLYFHGWDESKSEAWADSESGLSSQIWGRAVGWYAVAILDMLEYIPKDHPKTQALIEIELDLLRALVRFQDKKTGMWFQVTDKINERDNWIESSSTCLFVYSYAKAITMGLASADEFKHVIKKAYNGIVKLLQTNDNGDIIIPQICIGTCIERGDYKHYIDRKTVQNDLHGAGAFILMCSEAEKVKKFLLGG